MLYDACDVTFLKSYITKFLMPVFVGGAAKNRFIDIAEQNIVCSVIS